MLESIAREHPDFAPVHRYLGFSYRQDGQLSAAEAAFERCLTLRPESQGACYALATTKGLLGDYEGAIALLEQILEATPHNFEARYYRGLYLWKLGRFDEAAHHFRVAFEQEPTSEACGQQLVIAFMSAGRDEELRTLLADWLEQDPHQAVVRGALAQHYAARGEFAAAHALLREGVRLDPEDRNAVSNLAMLLAQCPDETIRSPTDAASLLERFCERTDYADASAVYELSMVYGLVGRLEEGLVMIERARMLADAAGKQALVESADDLRARLEEARAQKTRFTQPGTPVPQ
jgi:tetratricopeptide (TPR) repeat protein